MKAVICTKYGPPDFLELRDVSKPIPKDNEVLIRVHAASVNYSILMSLEKLCNIMQKDILAVKSSLL